MNTENHTVFHLSINHQGRVSLWDSAGDAMRGKEDGEINLEFKLTPAQTQLLTSTQRKARAPRRSK